MGLVAVALMEVSQLSPPCEWFGKKNWANVIPTSSGKWIHDAVHAYHMLSPSTRLVLVDL